jgi:hypothetical protein
VVVVVVVVVVWCGVVVLCFVKVFIKLHTSCPNACPF